MNIRGRNEDNMKIYKYTLIERLYYLCDRLYASDCDCCPVWEIQTSEERTRAVCPCWKNGKKMKKFIESRQPLKQFFI
jgi:hypothetical protein